MNDNALRHTRYWIYHAAIQNGRSTIKSQDARDNQTFPPPYSTYSKRKNTGLPPPPPKISASDTPQWRWTTSQCREWITEILAQYSEMERDTAVAKASEFDGFRPNIYLMSNGCLVDYLGAPGRAVYAILIEVWHTEGQFPYPHYSSSQIWTPDRIRWGFWEIGFRGGTKLLLMCLGPLGRDIPCFAVVGGRGGGIYGSYFQSSSIKGHFDV